MRIHITTIAPEKAAREIMDHMQRHGGEWIVNAVEDEGYVMARLGTLEGKRLERSASPCFCGPFNASWKLHVIAADLKAARKIGEGFKASKSERPRGRPKLRFPPRGDELLVMEVLSKEPLAVGPIAERIGIKAKRVANLIRALRGRNHVAVAGTEPTPGGVTDRHVYKVAA